MQSNCHILNQAFPTMTSKGKHAVQYPEAGHHNKRMHHMEGMHIVQFVGSCQSWPCSQNCACALTYLNSLN